MSGPTAVLRARIHSERGQLASSVMAVQRQWVRVGRTDDDIDAYLDSTALHLHAFYTGLESIFEEIARQIDRDLPSGYRWHVRLLEQMAISLEDARPPVLDADLVRRLDDYRRFRHLIRNVYAWNLIPDRIEPLVKSLDGVWRDVEAALDRFDAYLEGLAAEG